MRQGGGRWGVLVAVWALPLAAHAGANDQPYPVGERATGMGGAAAALTDDGTAPWYNPAGLGRVRSVGVSASLSAYGVQFDRTPAYYSANGQTASLSGWATVIFPSSLGLVAPLDIGRSARFEHAVGISVVIPDYERHEVTLSSPDPTFPFSGRERLLEQTIWVLPSWGACVDRLFCFGASLAGTYRTSSGQYSAFTNSSSLDPSGFRALTLDEDTTQFGIGFQGGLQWRVSPSWSLGISVRSPIRTLYGTGRLLLVESNIGGTAAPREVSDNNLWTDYRLPLYTRAGVAYDSGRLALAADLELSMPQDPYAMELGQGGADWVQPRATDGTPIGPPTNLTRLSRRKTIINASLGAEKTLSAKFSAQAGAFTDLSGTPDDASPPPDELHPRVNRFGLTLGFIRRSVHSTTHIAFVATRGWGTSYSLSDPSARPTYEATALYLTLGGSSDFADPDDVNPAKKPRGRPLFKTWWFWALIGGAVAGGAAAYLLTTSRGTGVPPSDYGAQRAP
jgi:hypothetical protein